MRYAPPAIRDLSHSYTVYVFTIADEWIRDWEYVPPLISMARVPREVPRTVTDTRGDLPMGKGSWLVANTPGIFRTAHGRGRWRLHGYGTWAKTSGVKRALYAELRPSSRFCAGLISYENWVAGMSFDTAYYRFGSGVTLVFVDNACQS